MQIANQPDDGEIDRILYTYGGDKSSLIQILLDAQSTFHWLPQNVLRRISEQLGIALSEVYRTASFYKALSLVPRGRHLIRICMGTACHVRGSPRILGKIEQFLNIRAGETTRDMRFSLERVNCLGCCALGPVIVVDGEAHGNLTPAEVEGILNRYE
ncbi:MAG: NAD(P)H-dependent oxidoreductase subunit E [Deltaproteobacteria bacterium]|nr:NAD(P)H-dependent oxidoreductase subunit E [Deltaproteobacteria bacterium]